MLRWEVTLFEKAPGLRESCAPNNASEGVLEDVTELAPEEVPEDALELNPLPSIEPEFKPPRSQGLSEAESCSPSLKFSSSWLLSSRTG